MGQYAVKFYLNKLIINIFSELLSSLSPIKSRKKTKKCDVGPTIFIHLNNTHKTLLKFTIMIYVSTFTNLKQMIV